jgi:hypothetical protein
MERREEGAELSESDLDWPCLIIHQRPLPSLRLFACGGLPHHNSFI